MFGIACESDEYKENEEIKSPKSMLIKTRIPNQQFSLFKLDELLNEFERLRSPNEVNKRFKIMKIITTHNS